MPPGSRDYVTITSAKRNDNDQTIIDVVGKVNTANITVQADLLAQGNPTPVDGKSPVALGIDWHCHFEETDTEIWYTVKAYAEGTLDTMFVPPSASPPGPLVHLVSENAACFAISTAGWESENKDPEDICVQGTGRQGASVTIELHLVINSGTRYLEPKVATCNENWAWEARFIGKERGDRVYLIRALSGSNTDFKEVKRDTLCSPAK